MVTNDPNHFGGVLDKFGTFDFIEFLPMVGWMLYTCCAVHTVQALVFPGAKFPRTNRVLGRMASTIRNSLIPFADLERLKWTIVAIQVC